MTANMSVGEIYTSITDRQTEALMLHDQLTDLFGFLGLTGFKKMHEYQHLTESLSRGCVKRYYMGHHNKLVMSETVKDPDIIPDEWLSYTRHDVTPAIRKSAVEMAFKTYLAWEIETKNRCNKYVCLLYTMGCASDARRIGELLDDVDMELSYLDELLLRLEAGNYSDIVLDSLQEELYDKYEELIADISMCTK